MMQIEKIKKIHAEEVLKRAKEFYTSPAVSHPVSHDILEATLLAAISDSSLLDGYVFREEGSIVGFAYISSYFACETGGICVMIEEVFLDESCRGKGYGTKFLEFVFAAYPEAKRFRLEVTEENKDAVRLYEKMGFVFITYQQMVKDKKS